MLNPESGEMTKRSFDVVQCCECGRYLDKKTRKFVPKPKEPVHSHTYCDGCSAKLMTELDRVMSEFKVSQRVRNMRK